MPPKVSVLMSVRNGADYLREAVGSVFAQTMADFEFILIDNGSTDGTADIIANYHDPRLVLLHNPVSLTLTEALNQGLERAVAPYVARLDADDVALPGRLASQLAYMEANPGVAAVGTSWIEFDGRGNERLCPPLPLSHREIVDAMADRTPIAHPSLMLRTRAARAVGNYPTAYAYAQDYALYLELVLAGYTLANLPGPPQVRIRIHSAQASHDPAWAVLRTRESLDVYKRGGRLPGQSTQARLGNARRITRCHLQHALALWRSGRRAGALGQIAGALAANPLEALRLTASRLHNS